MLGKHPTSEPHFPFQQEADLVESPNPAKELKLLHFKNRDTGAEENQ